MDAEISKGAKEDISALLTGEDRTKVALNALGEAINDGSLTEEQLGQLQTLASGSALKSQTSPLITISRRYIPDSRQGYGSHSGAEFNVTVNSGASAIVFLQETLGEDADHLIYSWQRRVNLDQKVPAISNVVLFTNPDDQQEDLKGAGYQSANDLQATIVCAILVKKAKDAGLNLKKTASTWASEQSEALEKLEQWEKDLLSKLKTNCVKTASGALHINNDGILSAGSIHCDRVWMLGSCAA